MLHQFFGVQEAIVQNQVGSNTKLRGQRLQFLAVALAFEAPEMGMRHSGDDIDHIGVPDQNHREYSNPAFIGNRARLDALRLACGSE